MANTDIFLDKYKQLEEVVRSTYGLKDEDSISYYLNGKTKFNQFRNEIKYCQDVRNLLSHKQKVKDSFAVEPSQGMIDFIDSLINRIKGRRKCREIQIGFANVYWETLDGNVKKTIKAMRSHVYTHIPILKDGVVTGIFDENSIFNYLADNEIIEVDDALTFRNIEQYLSLSDRELETFLFSKADRYVDELECEIESYFQKGQRVGVVFITQNGAETEKLLGIITPWDIIASAN